MRSKCLANGPATVPLGASSFNPRGPGVPVQSLTALTKGKEGRESAEQLQCLHLSLKLFGS